MQLPTDKTEELLHYFAIDYEDRERLKKLYRTASKTRQQMVDKVLRDLFLAWYEIRVMEEIYEGRILAHIVSPQDAQFLRDAEKRVKEKVEDLMISESQPPKSDLVDRILFILRRTLEP